MATKKYVLLIQTSWRMLHQVKNALEEARDDYDGYDDTRFEVDVPITINAVESAILDVKELADNHGITLFDYPTETV